MLDLWNVIEELECRLDIHLEHVGDRLVFEFDAECLAVEAMPFADRARNPNVSEKIHLEFRRAVSFARLATPAIHVETKSTGFVASTFRLRQLREQSTDVVEDLYIGTGIRSGCATNRRLVDGDQLIEKL